MQKFVSMSVAAVIMLGMAFSSQAQKRMVLDRVPLPITHVLQGRYDSQTVGTEVSEGAVDPISNQVYGWNFHAMTAGPLEGHLFIFLNYSQEQNIGVEINPSGRRSTLSLGVHGPRLSTSMAYIRVQFQGQLLPER